MEEELIPPMVGYPFKLSSTHRLGLVEKPLRT
jgi:hypothetical protein